MKTTILRTAVAAGLALSAPVPAQAGPVAPATETVDLRVCNESGRNARVAISYVEVGTRRFINRGWYDVADGACADLVSTDNANFYMYGDAVDGSGRSWSGDHTLCVQYPGPYTFWSDGDDACPSGYKSREFVSMHAEDIGPYTWTLEP
ncbi:MAG: DUF1036 domain-containing protein [Pseudomonadota bacterium]|nr:DUF1036 domain-containing protein [Pseudomonadota bacterium]